jgi:hypothetical protein
MKKEGLLPLQEISEDQYNSWDSPLKQVLLAPPPTWHLSQI